MTDNQAIPYNLKSKATRLPEGPDATLDPPVAPTDAERRGIPPIFWAAMDKSKGGTAPQDAPLAPPAVDPARRSVPAFEWARGLPGRLANRALGETGMPMPVTLDPDIALWPMILWSIWPFAGAPTEGVWPKGWCGVDNTSTLWVCTVGGEPGTWEQVGSGGGSGWPSSNGSGPGNLQAETASDDTVGYNLNDQGSGGFNAQVTGTGAIVIANNGSGTGSVGVEISNSSDAETGISISNTGIGTLYVQSNTEGGVTISANGGQLSLDSTRSVVASATEGLMLQGGTSGTTITPGTGGLFVGLPTSDPDVTGQLWNDEGVVVFSGYVSPLTPIVDGITAPVSIVTGSPTLVYTETLSVGRWLVTITGTAAFSAASGIVTDVAAGTGTMTFIGQIASDVITLETSDTKQTIALTFEANVTVAGTMTVNMEAATATVLLENSGLTAVKGA